MYCDRYLFSHEDEGQLFGGGDGSYGQLGPLDQNSTFVSLAKTKAFDGEKSSKCLAVNHVEYFDKGRRVKAVSCGESFTLVLLSTPLLTQTMGLCMPLGEDPSTGWAQDKLTTFLNQCSSNVLPKYRKLQQEAGILWLSPKRETSTHGGSIFTTNSA